MRLKSFPAIYFDLGDRGTRTTQLGNDGLHDDGLCIVEALKRPAVEVEAQDALVGQASSAAVILRMLDFPAPHSP